MVELRESQKKTDELFRRTDVKFLELKESQKRTEEQLRRTDEKLDRVGAQLADLGLVQGEVAEDLFVLTQTDEGGAALLNKENFRAKDFS
jgi:hypothetical protein